MPTDHDADGHPPTLAAIHIAPASRLPMVSVDRARVHTGGGIEGDRYEHSRHRHVTVQSATQLAEAAQAHGSPIGPGDTRRNLTISHGRVPAAPGDRLAIGVLELEVVRIAAPCRLLDDVIGPGAKDALRRRAGSVCRVLSGGVVTVGDVARLR